MLHCNNLCGAQPRPEKDSSPKKGPAFATFCYKETLPWIESTKRGTEGATSTMLFVGRLPVIATLDELDEAALVQILTEPKNALTKQYGKLFEMEGVELEFRPDALKSVAHKALERKTGARGLRSILEGILLDTRYEIPSQSDVSKVVIDESVIDGTSKPLLIYENSELPAKAAPDA
jgi:hypothetical protein